MAVSCSFNAIAIDGKFLPDINILVSSANKTDRLVVYTVVKSLMYNKNSNGPKIYPCDTFTFHLFFIRVYVVISYILQTIN